MALELPASLSPSKVSSFTDCALAFRFSSIDRLPEPPSLPATKGTLVHAALERLFALPAERAHAARRADRPRPGDRRPPAPTPTSPASTSTPRPRPASSTTPSGSCAATSSSRIRRPSPRSASSSSSRSQIGGLRLRGIIDRLELDADGRLVVTDYKTGRVPRENNEQGKLGGVHFYAFLCERLFGQRPARVQLLYLDEPVAIVTTPTEQSIRGLERKVTAIWTAVERACATEDFRPKPSKLCDWCAFQAYCPAFGGNPGRRQGQPGSIS